MRILLVAAVMAMAGGALAQDDPIGAMEAVPGSQSPRRSAVADDDIGTAPADARSDPDRVVCRRTKPRTGSRLVRDSGDTLICQTEAEWERAAELGREVLKERDRGLCAPSCGPQ